MIIETDRLLATYRRNYAYEKMQYKKNLLHYHSLMLEIMGTAQISADTAIHTFSFIYIRKQHCLL